MSMLEHHFPTLAAEKYGVNAAILLRDIHHWCETNQNNGVHFHEGRWWTYQTITGLCRRHTYWTKNQMEHIIRTCKEKGALLSGHFSENQFDRTCWYALTDEASALFEASESISGISETESGDLAETGRKNQKCYKDKDKTKHRTDNPPPPKKHSGEAAAVFDEYAGADAGLRQRLADFQESRREKKKPMRTRRAAKILTGRLERLSGGDRERKLVLLDNAILHNWDSVYPLKPDELPMPPPEACAEPLRGEGVRYL